MDKIIFKHIVPYIPYGLYVYEKSSWVDKFTLVKGIDLENFRYRGEKCILEHDDSVFEVRQEWFSLHMVKPVLRNFDLNKPIIHNGEEFIPLQKLAQTSMPDYNWAVDNINYVTTNTPRGRIRFGYDFQAKGFIIVYGRDREIAENQWKLFDLLNEWKFDYRGLVNGVGAIAADDFDTNPYNMKENEPEK